MVPGGATYSLSSVGREGTSTVSGGRPSVAETLQAHDSVICLQHLRTPPHSTTEQVSLKKVSTTAPLVLGRKSDTEEPSKQKKLKQRELPWT